MPLLTIVSSPTVFYWFRDYVTNDSSVFVTYMAPSYLALFCSSTNKAFLGLSYHIIFHLPLSCGVELLAYADNLTYNILL